MNELKLFIHIPKTGGTTIVDTLKKQIYFEKFVRLNPTRDTHPKDFLASAPEYLKQVIQNNNKAKVTGGHIPFGALSSLEDPSRYFTVLRDPVERVTSEYYFMKQLGYYHQRDINSEELSLKDYLHHPATQYLNNLQTRLISGVSYEEGEMVDDDMYQLAANNLSRFLSVGITERMPETLALFHTLLGWSRTPHYTHSNVNNQRPATKKVDQETLEAIKLREKYDLQLYKEAMLLFQKQLDQQPGQINAKVKSILKPRPLSLTILKIYSKIRRTINSQINPVTGR